MILKRTVFKIKKKFPNACADTIERAFVDSYGKQNNLSFRYAFEIEEFLDKKDYSKISEFITNNISLQRLDELVIAFECLIDQNKNDGGHLRARLVEETERRAANLFPHVRSGRIRGIGQSALGSLGLEREKAL